MIKTSPCVRKKMADINNAYKLITDYIQSYKSYSGSGITMPNHNNLKQIRAKALLSKAELARKAGVSVLTISRIEQGMDCRMDTMRKVIQALGLKITEKEKVFPV